MNDIIVVSDLHLGRGRNPQSGRWHTLEAFFFDDDFARFCQHLCADARARDVPFTLVLAGDVLDLLRIEPEVAIAPASAAARRYGPPLTPARAAALAGHIVRGHPTFFAALGDVLDSGHEIVFLPGNHDNELQWRPVQEVVRAAVLARARAGGAARLRFAPWFHHEPGRIWIEHGSQYDRDGAYAWPLRGELGERPDFAEGERDLPLGNFFQRYLFNAFGALTFVVPSSGANFSYMKWLTLHRPRLLARMIASHAPFLRQVLRRIAHLPSDAGELRRVHTAELERLAETTGLGERLRAIDELKVKRREVARAVALATRQALRLLAGGATAILLAITLFFVSFQLIQGLEVGFGLKTLLFLLINVVVVAVAGTLAVGWMLRASPTPPDPTLPARAERIAELLDVPLVAFGHTHDEAIVRLRGGGWYFNTGTWISTFVPDTLLPRERIQLTFLRVRGTHAELLHFSPSRGEPVPVILIDDD
jgi:UDP-2,3-diacylglucosamine pyrophosphatase LpxH